TPPAEPSPSVITPADLPSPDLSAAVNTLSQVKQFYLPTFGVQSGPERIGMAASKIAQAIGVTSQNVLDAMESAAQASMPAAGVDPTVHAVTGDLASNAAFFARIPLREALTKRGVPPEAMGSL